MVGLGKTALQETAEFGIVLDEDEAVLRDAAPDQGLRDRAGAGPEFDHGPGQARVDVGRHRPRQHLARRGDRARDEGPLEPGTQEPRLVLEAVQAEAESCRGAGR